MLKYFTHAVESISVKQFLLALLCINFAQAFCTPISADEAYYALYAQKLAWGYFDHPPLIAIYVWLGQKLCSIFNASYSTIALRFSAVISFYIALNILWKCIDDDSQKVKFILASLSFLLLQAFGFISTPDSPLLLATSIFLLVYKKFIHTQSTENTIFLGCTMALMMYAKYHSGLFFLLIIAGNLSVLRSAKAWLAVLISVLLFVPHLWWQFQNNFPSFQYHLADRAADFKWTSVPEYALNILLCYHLIFLPSSLKILTTKHIGYRNSLKHAIIGFPVFFAVMLTRGHVQPQWLLLIVPTYLVFICNKESNINLKHLSIIALINIVAITLVRIILLLPQGIKGSGFENKKEIYQQIKEKAKGKTVAPCDGYQMAAYYTFYTNDTNVTCPYSFYGRASQHQIHSTDENLEGKDVYALFNDPRLNADTFVQQHINGQTKIYGLNLPYVAFTSLRAVNVMLQTTALSFDITNPYKHTMHLGDKTAVQIMASVKDVHNTTIAEIQLPVQNTNIAAKATAAVKITLPDEITKNKVAATLILYVKVHGVIDGQALCKSISLIH
jgi:hypothetical protein